MTICGCDVLCEAEYFRVTFNSTSIPYTPQLGDRSTDEFSQAAAFVKGDVESIYEHVPGQQTVEVLQFRSVIFGQLRETEMNKWN